MVSLGLVKYAWFTKAAATIVKMSSASACAVGVVDGSKPLATIRAASSPHPPSFGCWVCDTESAPGECAAPLQQVVARGEPNWLKVHYPLEAPQRDYKVKREDPRWGVTFSSHRTA